MNEILQQWLSRLKGVEVPVLSGTLQALAAMHEDDDATAQDLGDLIAADYGMSLNLLRMVNAENSSSLSNEIYTIDRLLMLKGTKGVMNFVHSLPVAEELWPEEKCQQWYSITAISYHRAMHAYHFALWKQDFVPDEVFTGAYFHDFAEKLLFVVGLTLDGNEVGLPEPDFNVDQLSISLCDAWSLPSLVSDSLHLEKTAETRVLAIMLANELVQSVQASWYSEKTLACLKQASLYLGFGEDETIARVHRVAIMAARNVHSYMSVNPAWVHPLVQLHSESDEEPAPQEVIRIDIEANAAVFQEVVTTLISPRALKKTVPQLIDLTLEGMHHGLGIQRVVFAMLTPDGEALRAVQIMGNEHELGFNRFELDVERDNLFGRVLDKRKAVWVTSENREKVMPLVPPKTLEVLHVDSFILVPVIVNDQALGLFYADQDENPHDLTENQYRGVAQLANSFARVLEQR